MNKYPDERNASVTFKISFIVFLYLPLPKILGTFQARIKSEILSIARTRPERLCLTYNFGAGQSQCDSKATVKVPSPTPGQDNLLNIKV